MASILVVDDEPAVAEFVGVCLARSGHKVSIATDGAQAAARLAADCYDLLITDVFMPGMDGLEVMREARRRVPGQRILAVSGGGYAAALDCLDMARLLGASEVLGKPFSPAALRDTVGAVLAAPAHRPWHAAGRAAPVLQ